MDKDKNQLKQYDGAMNRVKKYSGIYNSSKNKLNSEIILIFNPNPNTQLGPFGYS